MVYRSEFLGELLRRGLRDLGKGLLQREIKTEGPGRVGGKIKGEEQKKKKRGKEKRGLTMIAKTAPPPRNVGGEN